MMVLSFFVSIRIDRQVVIYLINTKNSEFSKKTLTSTFNKAIINTITVRMNDEWEGT